MYTQRRRKIKGSAVSNGLRQGFIANCAQARRSRDRPSISQNRLENEAERKWENGKKKRKKARRKHDVSCLSTAETPRGGYGKWRGTHKLWRQQSSGQQKSVKDENK
jgi:hypothetical protein